MRQTLIREREKLRHVSRISPKHNFAKTHTILTPETDNTQRHYKISEAFRITSLLQYAKNYTFPTIIMSEHTVQHRNSGSPILDRELNFVGITVRHGAKDVSNTNNNQKTITYSTISADFGEFLRENREE